MLRLGCIIFSITLHVLSQANMPSNMSLAALAGSLGKMGKVAVPKQADVSAADLALQQLSGQVTQCWTDGMLNIAISQACFKSYFIGSADFGLY